MYLKCDIMNNAGIVDSVDCACKLNRVPTETQTPLHALLGDHICVDSNECCNPLVNTVVPDNTLLGTVKISPIPITTVEPIDYREIDIVSVKKNLESHYRAHSSQSFTSNDLRKKKSDKHGTNKNSIIFPVSNCICKTHKWKFPMIMQKAWKHNRRVRLKSNASFNNMPLQRYQSHHSSSDEDWFEEIADDETNNCDVKKNKYNVVEDQTLADDYPVNFDNESNRVATNKFKWCSSFVFRKLFDKRPLTETKMTRKDPNNFCKII